MIDVRMSALRVAGEAMESWLAQSELFAGDVLRHAADRTLKNAVHVKTAVEMSHRASGPGLEVIALLRLAHDKASEDYNTPSDGHRIGSRSLTDPTLGLADAADVLLRSGQRLLWRQPSAASVV